MTFPHESTGLWESLISSFEATNPSVHIEPVYQEVGIAWYKQADVAIGPAYAWWRDAAEQGGLLDLTSLIEADREFQPDDFYPGMLSLYRQDGHTWAIPYGVSHAVLVYAPSLFQEIGIPMPALDWTWADLWEAARRITASSSIERRRYSFLDQTTFQLLIPDWIAERSGGLYQEQNSEVVPVLNTPKVQQVVAECLGIAGGISALLEKPADMTPAEILDRVARGEVGMVLLPLGTVMRYRDRYPELALASLPPGEVAAQTALNGWSELLISAGTAHRQAAWQWVSFLSHQDLGPWRSGDLPARRSVVKLTHAWEHLPPPEAAVVQQNLKNQTQYIQHGEHRTVRSIYSALSEALANVRDGRLDVESALVSAQQKAVAEIRAGKVGKSVAESTPVSIPTPAVATKTSMEFQVNTATDLYQAEVAIFEKEHPQWHVRVSTLSIQEPKGCFAVILENNALTKASIQELLTDMDPLTEIRGLSHSDFWAQAIAATTWQGKLRAMPASIKPLVLFYNPTIFQEANLEPPTANWTVEDILEAAEKIESAGKGYFGYLPQAQEMRFLLEQQGILLFTDDRPPHPRFTHPDVIQALGRWQHLSNETVTFPLSYQDAVSLRRSGRIGMWFDVFNYWPADAGESRMLATPIQLRVGTTLPTQVSALGLTPDTIRPEFCWEWITFLVQRGVSPDDELPALQYLAEKRAAAPGTRQELYQAYREMLRRTESAPLHTNPLMDYAGWWFTAALQTDEDHDLATALQTAQDKAEAFLACLGPAGEDDLRRAADCARQVDPAHPLAQLHR